MSALKPSKCIFVCTHIYISVSFYAPHIFECTLNALQLHKQTQHKLMPKYWSKKKIWRCVELIEEQKYSIEIDGSSCKLNVYIFDRFSATTINRLKIKSLYQFNQSIELISLIVFFCGSAKCASHKLFRLNGINETLIYFS